MSKYKGCQHCIHFRPDGTCPAFDPDLIPLPIVSGEIKHIKPLPNQKNEIVYEPAGKSMIYRIADLLKKEKTNDLDDRT